MKRLKISRKNSKSLLFFGLFAAFALFVVFFAGIVFRREPTGIIQEIATTASQITHPTATPTPTIPPVPQTHIIPLRTHVFQSFNNCGPATLSMALSYMGIQKDQAELGQILRPYQVPGGDNDDKSVTLQEVAAQAATYGLHTYLRPNGTIEKMQQFISYDIPVVARTWLETNEDIGHYRVVRGYDNTTQQVIQDDSLQGKDLRYSYDEYLKLWQPFNYEYLIIVDDSKKEIAEKILGEELDENVAWENALTRIEQEISQEPDNWHLTFAKSRIHYYLGDYQQSVEEFEKVEGRLSFRTLWYQIEPIRSYYELGDYEKVLATTNQILNNQNRAFSELYIIRGDIFKNQGNSNAARGEYEKAVLYNVNKAEAKQRLESV